MVSHRVRTKKQGPFEGLPTIDICAPDWIKEANLPHQTGQPMLTEEEFDIIAREARENPLLEDDSLWGCIEYDASGGKLLDCYKKIIFRNHSYEIRSMEQWKALKVEAKHLEETGLF